MAEIRRVKAESEGRYMFVFPNCDFFDILNRVYQSK